MAFNNINKFINNSNLETPFLVIDLSLVTKSYKNIKKYFPDSKIYYAVKANPAKEILNCLKNEGSYFDVSSKNEIKLCLSQSIKPSNLSFGNTIKKEKDILWAYKQGVELFAFDSIEELNKIENNAKNSKVFCRLQVPNQGANWPLSKKFGCSVNMAKDLMLKASKKSLIPAGLSFHVGSQQTNINRWVESLKLCFEVYSYLKEQNILLDFINIGGGIPVDYVDYNFDMKFFSAKLDDAIKNIFHGEPIKIILEPGRSIVAEAGIIESEVILVSKKNESDKKRWVYLDIGRFGGLAETEAEAIRYKIISVNNNSECSSVNIAGPSCDGADIIYEKYNYELPINLKSGDKVRFHAAGAYTSVYVSDFNGLQRLREYFIK